MTLDNRNIKLDLIRVISMFFVIMVHTLVKLFYSNNIFKITMESILFTCNGMFFMLSGYFNLDKKITSKEDYKKYYKNKLIKIIIPFIICSFFINTWNTYIIDHKTFDILRLLKEFYIKFMSGNISVHLWFMYPLTGCLLSAPFLGKLFQKLSNYELNLIFKISIFWNIVSIYLTKDLGINFSFNSWMLSSWSLFFFLGYYYKKVINENNKNKLYILGIIGLIITIVCRKVFGSNFNNANDLSIFYVFFTVALFTFISNEIKINNKYFKNSIKYLAKYSFYVYLLHFNILNNIVLNIIKPSPSIFKLLLVALITLIISLIISIFLDILIFKPLTEILQKNRTSKVIIH
ncbi:MAG: acyltransferase [Bacilli bacterium]|nr:acyltransferase [Bacilli bacterium]